MCARRRRCGKRVERRVGGTTYSRATTTTGTAGSRARKRGGTGSRPCAGATRRTRTPADVTLRAVRSRPGAARGQRADGVRSPPCIDNLSQPHAAPHHDRAHRPDPNRTSGDRTRSTSPSKWISSRRRSRSWGSRSGRSSGTALMGRSTRTGGRVSVRHGTQSRHQASPIPQGEVRTYRLVKGRVCGADQGANTTI